MAVKERGFLGPLVADSGASGGQERNGLLPLLGATVLLILVAVSTALTRALLRMERRLP